MKTEMRSLCIDKPGRWIATSHAAEHASEIAHVSDRWFLSLTGGIANLGSWAEREAWIVADSAVAAFATTVTLAKRFTSTAPIKPAKAPLEPRPTSQEPQNLDLICGVRPGEEPAVPDPLGVDRAAQPGLSSAGVIPLLQALERTVAKHTHAGAGSLQEDPRFWTLIHLIERLGRPASTLEETEPPPGSDP
jgi:hypothetical protein